MSYFDRMKHTTSRMQSIAKGLFHRHGDGSGRFANAQNSAVGLGSSDPKSPHYTPIHLVRDPEPNPKNTYRVHHGDHPLTHSMPRTEAAAKYAVMLEKVRPYAVPKTKEQLAAEQKKQQGEQNTVRTGTPQNKKGRNRGMSEERGNSTG